MKKRVPTLPPVPSPGLLVDWPQEQIQRWAAHLISEVNGFTVLLNAVQDWAADRTPKDEGEFNLLIALWQILGDRTEACPGCDGTCGEPCAPVTAKAAIAALERGKAALGHAA